MAGTLFSPPKHPPTQPTQIANFGYFDPILIKLSGVPRRGPIFTGYTFPVCFIYSDFTLKMIWNTQKTFSISYEQCAYHSVLVLFSFTAHVPTSSALMICIGNQFICTNAFIFGLLRDFLAIFTRNWNLKKGHNLLERRTTAVRLPRIWDLCSMQSF